MLSFIYRLTRDFEKEHGFIPNLLYVNGDHLSVLRIDLAGIPQLAGVTRLLGMEVVVSDEVTHPHVAWSCPAQNRATG
jgi:Iap family predicted aminopeptidase